MPFIRAVVLEDFALMLERDAFDLWLDLETFRDIGETIDNRLERFLLIAVGSDSLLYSG